MGSDSPGGWKGLYLELSKDRRGEANSFTDLQFGRVLGDRMPRVLGRDGFRRKPLTTRAVGYLG
jgi:hypothetical protein